MALLRNGRRPWQLYADLVEEAGGALAVLEEEAQQDASQASLFPADHRSALRTARGEIEAWEAHGLELLTVLDRGYPDNLRAVHDRPPLIFVAGALRPTDTNAVAVVGARTPSPDGVKVAAAIATHLVARGYAVASGLASGIDTAAHTAALSSAVNGRTLAVIGTGLNRSYPPENAALQRRIATEGAVISQFWPDAPPSRRSFPMRNAVMSGLALATVVVEASHTSGSRTQAPTRARPRPACVPARIARRPARMGARIRAAARRSRGALPGRDHERRRATQPGGRPGAVVPSVRELTALCTNFMLGPRAGPDVCGTCFNFTRGYGRCYACTHNEPRLDAVAPISYSVAREQLHHALAHYKRLSGDVARRLTVELAAVLWRYIAQHEPCLAKAAGVERFEVVTTVPSGERARDEQHPLRHIVGDLIGTNVRAPQAAAQTVRRPSPTPRIQPAEVPASDPANGQSVLLIDDTWTTGASAQSAAATLKDAGAGHVAAIVIGVSPEPRMARERSPAAAERTWPFDWERCALCN